MRPVPPGRWRPSRWQMMPLTGVQPGSSRWSLMGNVARRAQARKGKWICCGLFAPGSAALGVGPRNEAPTAGVDGPRVAPAHFQQWSPATHHQLCHKMLRKNTTSAIIGNGAHANSPPAAAPQRQVGPGILLGPDARHPPPVAGKAKRRRVYEDGETPHIRRQPTTL